MNKFINGMMWALLAAGLSNSASADRPVFLLAPIVTGPEQLTAGQNGTAIYQVFNNSPQNLTNIGLVNLPGGASYIPSAGDQYCSSTFNLAAGAACLIKIQMNSPTTGNIQGGPKVCFPATRPIYCSQPLNVDQLATQVTPGPVATTCQGNITNFNYELSQPFDTTPINPYWGPSRNKLLLSPANPNLTNCPTTNLSDSTGITWMQNRVIAAEEFWVKQKLNYCHHHVPDWQTPAVVNNIPRDQLATSTYPGSPGGQCSSLTNIMPGSVYYNQAVRWNYNGTGSETNTNWLNNNLRWYGVDCSDFTSFIYNFSFGIQFNSDTGYQAGQKNDGTQDTLYPNKQTLVHHLQPFNNSDPDSPAGVLVCKDGSTEQENPECGGYGTNGYFSVFLYPNASADPQKPAPTASNITESMLNYLQPGDLIFLGFAGKEGNNPTSMVTHVITWTGKKIGYGTNDVNPSLIAPQTLCTPDPNAWKPKIAAWVIIDSTYQGPDFRMFADCPYKDNIYGVRRVIGYMQ